MMADKTTPGGVLHDPVNGKRLDEPSAVNLEARLREVSAEAGDEADRAEAAAKDAAASAARAEAIVPGIEAEVRAVVLASPELKGEPGAPGPAPSIKIGTVTSGATPSATIKGTSPDLTLDLVLPQPAPGAVVDPYSIRGPGRPDVPSTTGGVITGAEPVGAEYRSTDGAGVGAWTWTRRPGGKWHVTNGDSGWRDVTAQTWVHETNTYATPGGTRMGTVIRITTTGMDLIVRGSGGGTNPGVAIETGQHLRIPVLRSLLPAQFTWNSYSNLPHGLREYYGDIAIQWNRAPDAAWFLPRDPATWPSTLPGSPT